MKQLILVRHAKTAKKRDGLPDFVRSLTRKGIEQAKKISKKLKKRIEIPGLFISSPANRALETAHRFASEYGYPRKRIVLKDELYNPLSEQEFLGLIKEINDNIHSAIIFGHDPAISNFVKFLAKNFQEEMPPCSVAAIEFKKDSWKDIAKGLGEILYYEYPKRQAIYYAQISSGLESEIYEQLIRVVKKTNEKAAMENEQSVRNWAKEIAGKFTAMLRAFRKKENKAGEEQKGQPVTVQDKTSVITKGQEKPGQ